VFEAVSAFTTTGATVILELDGLPPSILFWRQELQWLGGIGVIVSGLAILPLLGLGGMQLYRAEVPGPIKDEKLTPRIMQTARALWHIYAGLTVACVLAYWLGGMSLFDAVGHAFSTVSTGGFSTHTAGLAYYDSGFIEAVACVFMLLGAINFGVHYAAFTQVSAAPYARNPEVRLFLWTVAVLIAFSAATLLATGAYQDGPRALRDATFQVISVITSTGFTTADFSTWPLALPVLLMFSSFMGGCAGSTAGGMKVLRFMLLAKQGALELQRIIHPRLQKPLKVGDRVVPESMAAGVWGFFALYLVTFAVLMVVLMTEGMDQVTAFGAVATCINNLGPGLGDVARDFHAVGDTGKLLLSFAMLLGRLEILTVLVLFSPGFWRT
jgi:trk system potassium uptake protein TrkH